MLWQVSHTRALLSSLSLFLSHYSHWLLLTRSPPPSRHGSLSLSLSSFSLFPLSHCLVLLSLTRALSAPPHTSMSLSHCLFFSLMRPLSHLYCFSLSRCLSCSLMVSLAHFSSLKLVLSLALSLALSHTLSLRQPLLVSITRCFCHSLSPSHAVSIDLSRCLSCSSSLSLIISLTRFEFSLFSVGVRVGCLYHWLSLVFTCCRSHLWVHLTRYPSHTRALLSCPPSHSLSRSLSLALAHLLPPLAHDGSL